ncbi:MAG: F0F1 ATP synthase subunit B [Armatimonadetes bacterium]|nr:F0F1 ATP synthase subunit B [Armatimonadota bacterium]
MSEKSYPKKSSAPMTIGMIIVGAALMYGGMYMSSNVTLGFQESLNEQGILLDLGKTIAVIGVFLILFKVLDLFFFNPLHVAIDTRTDDLERTFGEAESLRAEMTQMKSEYEKRLADTEADARAQIQAQIKEAQDLKKSLMADAQRQADDYKQTAIAEIDAEKKKVMTELRVEVTKLSLQATEKILGANVDSDRNRKLIDEFLTSVEAKN